VKALRNKTHIERSTSLKNAPLKSQLTLKRRPRGKLSKQVRKGIGDTMTREDIISIIRQAMDLLDLRVKGRVIITPCAVGDYIRTKYDDEVLRVDGFTTYGDDLKVWCEGESENEDYTEFELSEITEFIPREKYNETNKN
jgi:hypothetical protein